MNKTLELFHGGNIPSLQEARDKVYFTAGFHTAQGQGEQVIKIELPITPTGRPAGKWEKCFEKINAGTYVFDPFGFKLNLRKHNLDINELNEFQILYPKKEAKMNNRNLKDLLFDVGNELVGQEDEGKAIVATVTFSSVKGSPVSISGFKRRMIKLIDEPIGSSDLEIVSIKDMKLKEAI